MALTLATFDAFTKDYYNKRPPENLYYQDNPALALIKKIEKFPGRRMPVPMVTFNPQSRSATFATAQSIANSNTSRVDSFYLTRVKNYGVITLDTEAMEASESEEGAFLEAKAVEMDGIIQSVGNDEAWNLFRAGFGARATVTALSLPTVTVSTSDILGIESGMVLEAAALEASGTLRAGTITVGSVNTRAGTFTVASGTITGLAVNDVLFMQGDRQNVASPARTKTAGLAAWCPATAPTSGDNFFGVDRSATDRLYGNFYNGTSEPVEDALISGANVVASRGFKLTHYFISFDQYARLTKNIQDSRRYIEVKASNAEIGFEAFTIRGPRGPIAVVPDRSCQRNTAWGCDIDLLAYYSIGKMIRVIDNDDNVALRQASADGIEIRVGYKGNFACYAPASLIQVTLAP